MSKRKIKQTESSDSEDEISKSILAEIADPQFFQENLFSQKGSLTPKKHETPKSLRKHLDNIDNFQNFGISEACKKFIAKKLDEMLEKAICLKNTDLVSCKHNKTKLIEKHGIKLLKNSQDFLNLETEEITKTTKITKLKLSNAIDYDESKNLQKCKEVAVDPEWILSKEAVKGWTNRRKDCVFKYKKLKNGTLVEIN